jgi:hypothetical protein
MKWHGNRFFSEILEVLLSSAVNYSTAAPYLSITTPGMCVGGLIYYGWCPTGYRVNTFQKILWHDHLNIVLA